MCRDQIWYSMRQQPELSPRAWPPWTRKAVHGAPCTREQRVHPKPAETTREYVHPPPAARRSHVRKTPAPLYNRNAGGETGARERQRQAPLVHPRHVSRAREGTPEEHLQGTPAGLARGRPGSLGRCRCWRPAGVAGWRRSVDGPSSCSRLHRQPVGVVHTCICEYAHHHVRACENLSVFICVCVCVRERESE